ncbi:hypothetical protein TNCV_2644041 [Trichonephila clavipes]|nr:hypothetical protein TNCV_2644041 [Trichonephila clavipes]
MRRFQMRGGVHDKFQGRWSDDGVVSYAMDRECPHELFKFLHHLNVGTICVTDQHSKQILRTSKPVGSPRAHSSETL